MHSSGLANWPDAEKVNSDSVIFHLHNIVGTATETNVYPYVYHFLSMSNKQGK